MHKATLELYVKGWPQSYTKDLKNINTILLLLHRKFTELEGFVDTLWGKKPEYPGQTTDLGRATTTLPHADAVNRTQVAVLTSRGCFTPVQRT